VSEYGKPRSQATTDPLPVPWQRDESNLEEAPCPLVVSTSNDIRKVDKMFKTMIAALVLAVGIMLAGATSAMAETSHAAPAAPASCPTDMHWC